MDLIFISSGHHSSHTLPWWGGVPLFRVADFVLLPICYPCLCLPGLGTHMTFSEVSLATPLLSSYSHFLKPNFALGHLFLGSVPRIPSLLFLHTPSLSFNSQIKLQLQVILPFFLVLTALASSSVHLAPNSMGYYFVVF